MVEEFFRLLNQYTVRTQCKTRSEAIETLYKIINSGIIDMELEGELTEIANCIEDDSFESDED